MGKSLTDEELEKTARRLRKRREALRSARESATWFNFIDDMGIDVNTSGRTNFFEKVREKIVEQVTPQPITQSLAEKLLLRGITVDDKKVYRDIKTGKFTAEKEGNIPVRILRDSKGRFTSLKKEKIS